MGDPFLTERLLHRVFLELGPDVFSQPDRVTGAIDGYMRSMTPIEEIARGLVELDPIEHAQELAWQALASMAREEVDRAVKLGKKALDLDIFCLDAHVLFARLFLATHEALDTESYGLMKEAALEGRRRLEERFGTNLAADAPEPLLRPLHRTWSLLLDEAPIGRRYQDAYDFAVQAMRLGPSLAMNVRGMASWLLWGGQWQLADELLDFTERSKNDDKLEPDSIPHLRWWRSWSAFQAGSLERSRHLALLAARDFPDSQLLLLADSDAEYEASCASEHLSENLEHFRSMVDALDDDDSYFQQARTWFGMEPTS